MKRIIISILAIVSVGSFAQALYITLENPNATSVDFDVEIATTYAERKKGLIPSKRVPHE